MTVISAIVLLGILIFVHELGHFLAAKYMGVKVEKFSLGFGPPILKKQWGETEYLLCALPLGGYVKMLGEDTENEGDEEKTKLTAKERLRAFNYQAIWKRAVIVLAGPVFNLVFAAIVLVLIFLQGVPALYSEVGEVMEGTPAEQVGLMSGDLIVQVDATPVADWSEMTSIIYDNPGKELEFMIMRGETELLKMITPERRTIKDIFGEDTEVGLIGIMPSGRQFTRDYGSLEAVGLGIQRTWEITSLTLVALVKLIMRVIPADNIGGPIMIFQLAGKSASAGFMDFFMFMAIISINLGIINLFPVPILDGGHLLFLGLEAIRGKPLPEKANAIAQKIGLTLILMLIVLATYNDVMRWVNPLQ